MKSNDLAARVDRKFPDGWRPKASDKLVGTITALDTRDGFGGEPYPIVTIRKDDGEELAWHAYGAVAGRELARLRPKVGEQIGVKDLGEVATEDHKRTYRGWRIVIAERDEQPFDWSRFGDDDPGAPGQPSLLDEPASDVPSDLDTKGGDDVPF